MEYIKLSDFVYLSTGCIFTGLECGILTSYLFFVSEENLKRMSMLEIYMNLLTEICFIAIVIYFLTPLLNYFGSPFDGIYNYKRPEEHTLNMNMLLITSYLIGARDISYKITAILNKSGFVKIKDKNGNVMQG